MLLIDHKGTINTTLQQVSRRVYLDGTRNEKAFYVYKTVRMKDLISVIIPTYNHSELIHNTINSVLNQTHKNIEIIIIDDGSTDDTKAVCHSYRDNHPNIKYYHQKNKGVSSARNQGLRRSNGDYIQFLDADDILLEKKLEIQLQQLKDSNTNAVHSDFYCLNYETNDRVNKGASAFTTKSTFLSDLILKWEIGFSIPCHCFLFKKKSLRRMRFKKRLLNHEDWEFYVRWASKDNWSEYLNEELCIYMKYPESLCTNKALMEKGYSKALQYISKTSKTCRHLVRQRKEKDRRIGL